MCKMIIVYILFNFLLYFYSKGIFKEKVNPISIYSTIWVMMLVTYELKLVEYYNLTFMTWCVIISFQLAYSIGCVLGQAKHKTDRYSTDENPKTNIVKDIKNKKIEDRLKLVILVLAAISALGIIPNLLVLINRYGNIFQATNIIYDDRLTGNQDFELIPYMGTLIHMSVILSGIYINRYGVKLFLTIPIVLMSMNILPSGGRSDFVVGFLFIAFTLIYGKKVNFTKKQKISLTILLSSFVGLFGEITSNRSTWISVNSYMSQLMVKLVDFNPAIYKMYIYFSSPVGVLNAYLKDPVYNFGINSFGVFFSVLNKFGANLNYQRYQDVYNIPITTNVGTYIRELMQDFTLIGGIIVIILFGYIFGRFYSKLKREKSFVSEIFVCLFSTIIFLSFFMWFYRETVFWISTFIGIPIGLYLDSYVRKVNKIYSDCTILEKESCVRHNPPRLVGIVSGSDPNTKGNNSDCARKVW